MSEVNLKFTAILDKTIYNDVRRAKKGIFEGMVITSRLNYRNGTIGCFEGKRVPILNKNILWMTKASNAISIKAKKARVKSIYLHEKVHAKFLPSYVCRRAKNGTEVIMSVQGKGASYAADLIHALGEVSGYQKGLSFLSPLVRNNNLSKSDEGYLQQGLSSETIGFQNNLRHACKKRKYILNNPNNKKLDLKSYKHALRITGFDIDEVAKQCKKQKI